MRFAIILSLVVLLVLAFAGFKEDWISTGLSAKQHVQCKPFGVRLNWGRSVYDPTSHQKLGIRFNTLKKCQNVDLLLNQQFIVHCPLSPISNFTLAKGQGFVSYTHQCSLTTQIEYDVSFTYNIIDQGTEDAYFEQKTVVLKNPKDANRQVKFIHLADWGRVKQMANTRPSITRPIKNILLSQQIDGIIINGDIGYSIHSNANHHLQFMAMLQQLSAIAPIIFNRGNHQYETATPFFCNYFQVYDLCSRNATALTIGSVQLNVFDPQLALIPRKFIHYTLQGRLSSKKNLETDLIRGKQSGSVLIAFSHYPLICSYPTSKHCIPDSQYNQILPLYVNLQQHYNALLQYKVPLVLSGHIHTYERSHRLLKGYRFKKNEDSNYVVKEQEEAFIVQVVDGVAGSDGDLYQKYGDRQPQPFLAAMSLNMVGFGLLKVNKQKINYEHIGVDIDGKMVSLDSFDIELLGEDANSKRIGDQL